MVEKCGILFDEYGIAKDDVDVSVYCVTYNHKEYIRKALDGFLSQKTTFIIEVFIFDDASTDGTSDIVKEYCDKYPEIFHGVIARSNTFNSSHRREIEVGLMKTYLTGKYCSFCEGDDYWIYEHKLQKQYEFMEKHPEVSCCVHNAIRYDEGLQEVVPQILDMDSGYEDKDEIVFCLHGRTPTASVFCRTELLDLDSKCYRLCPVGDDPIRIGLGCKGRLYYMDKVWAVRHYMHGVSWNKMMKTDLTKKRNHLIGCINWLSNLDAEINTFYEEQTKVFIRDMSRELLDLAFVNDITEVEFREYTKIIKDEFSHKIDEIIDDVYRLQKRNCLETICELKDISEDDEKKLYIYGAGIEGKQTLEFFKKKGIKFDGFVISSDGIGNCEGFPVYGINAIITDSDNTYFYLALRSSYRSEVVNLLKEKGFYKIF